MASLINTSQRDGFERRARRIRRSLVIARHDPRTRLGLDANLRRPEHVSCGQQGHARRADLEGLPVRFLDQRRVEPEPLPQQTRSRLGSEVSFATGSRVIAVGMRENCAGYGAPGIDVEISGWAVQAVLGNRNDFHTLG